MIYSTDGAGAKSVLAQSQCAFAKARPSSRREVEITSLGYK